MKRKILPVTILFIITVTLFAGCNNEPRKPQAVLLNMGAVGEATGITEQAKERTAIINQQISEEIKMLTAKLSKEFEYEKAALGDKPSEEDEKKIQTLQEQVNIQVTQARKEGNSRRVKEISELNQSFVDDIMSVAQQVASEHGASLILKAAATFWSDGSIDITDEVIARMNEGKDTDPGNSIQN